MDNQNQIPLSMPHLAAHEKEYVAKVLDSGWLAPNGEFNEKLEELLADFLATQRVLTLNSGTAAIHLALKLAGVQRGDYVLCSTFTFAASAYPIMYQGATPVFIDCEPHSWNLCPNALSDAIKWLKKKNLKPKAVIGVHSYGYPLDLQSVMGILEDHEIPLIEDAAEALGSKYGHKPCGSFGEFGVLSFNANKIVTGGGGGALILRNEEHYLKAKKWSQQAKENVFHYEHREVGYNYTMSNLIAALVYGQMENFEDILQKKSALHNFYIKCFIQLGVEYQTPKVWYGSTANYWLNTFVFEDETHQRLQDAFKADNIQTRPLWKPMHQQKVFEGSPYFGSGLSEQLFQNGICLPSGSGLKSNQLNMIAKVMEHALKS